MFYTRIIYHLHLRRPGIYANASYRVTIGTRAKTRDARYPALGSLEAHLASESEKALAATASKSVMTTPRPNGAPVPY